MEELIRKSDARRAVLKENPAIAHCIDSIKPVKAQEAKWQKQWHDTGMIGHMYEVCPICGCMISDTEKFWDCKFCPNCGTEMSEK